MSHCSTHPNRRALLWGMCGECLIHAGFCPRGCSRELAERGTEAREHVLCSDCFWEESFDNEPVNPVDTTEEAECE